jgi:hypothetical protein
VNKCNLARAYRHKGSGAAKEAAFKIQEDADAHRVAIQAHAWQPAAGTCNPEQACSGHVYKHRPPNSKTLCSAAVGGGHTCERRPRNSQAHFSAGAGG